MKKIRNLLLFVGILVSFNLSAQEVSYSEPKDYIIGGITVSGAEKLDKDILITISKLRTGQRVRIPGDQITRAVKDLWAQGLFNDVAIRPVRFSGDSVYLEIALEEAARMSNLVFRGVKKSATSDLKEKFQRYTNRPVNQSLLNRLKNIARDHFREKGYLFTEVSAFPRLDSARAGYADVVITVDRKRKIKVNDITFHGNESLPDRKLKKFMKNTKERKFYKIFGSKKYVPAKYEEDKDKLLSEYMQRGFRDIAIVADSVYRHDDRSVNVDITVSEGRKYYFGDLIWVGNAKYTDRQLNQLLKIERGDVYDEERLNKRLTGGALNSDDVASAYLNNGYLFSNITPVTTGVEGDTINLELRVYEGEQATIDEIFVKGNDRTNDKVIFREIYTIPGQTYSQAEVVRTINELRGLGYFNEEKLNVRPIPDPANGTVDIEYTVEERPSDQIQLSGGFGGGRIIGTLGLTFNNFSVRKLFSGSWGGLLPSGDGQRLSIAMQTNGRYYQNFNFTFSEPWLGGRKPQRLTVGFFSSRQTSFSYYDANPDQLLAINGVNVGLEKDLKWPDNYFKLSSVLSFERYKLNDWYSNSFVFDTGKAYTFSLTEQFSRTSLNHPIFPTSGSNVSLSVQFTPPYSLFNNYDYSDPNLSVQDRYRLTEFHKWKFNSQWFTPVAGKLVLKTQADFGFVGTYNRELGLTQFERFLLGGSGMQQFYNLNAAEIVGLRGYSDASVIPPGGDERVGAPIYNKYVMELRYPISVASSANIFVLAFAEGGNTWPTFSHFNPFNVKRSAGVGVRIFLPIFGLLGLDYGVAFDDIPGNPDAHQPFQFTINQAF